MELSSSIKSGYSHGPVETADGDRLPVGVRGSFQCFIFLCDCDLRKRQEAEEEEDGSAPKSLVVASGSHATLSASSFGSLAEKRDAALAEWRRKYGGRQRECVVCLEEYFDGVSKVMGLPCGHEFHADCM